MIPSLLFGPAGGALSALFGAPEAMADRDKQANPPRLAMRDRQRAARDAMDAHYGAKPPEPPWMGSWSGLGATAARNYDPSHPFPFRSPTPPGGPPGPPPGPAPAPPMPPPAPPAAPQGPQGGPWWQTMANLPRMGPAGFGAAPQPQPPPPPQAPAGPPMSLAPPHPISAAPSQTGSGFNLFGTIGNGLDGAVNDSASLVKKFYQDAFGK